MKKRLSFFLAILFLVSSVGISFAHRGPRHHHPRRPGVIVRVPVYVTPPTYVGPRHSGHRTFLFTARADFRPGPGVDWDSYAINTPWVNGIKIRVRQNQLRLDMMRVQFCNGASQTLNFRHHFAPGSSSAIKDLRAGARRICHVEFLYETPNPGPPALIDVYGVRY